MSKAFSWYASELRVLSDSKQCYRSEPFLKAFNGPSGMRLFVFQRFLPAGGECQELELGL